MSDLHEKPLDLYIYIYIYLEYVTLEKCNMILTLSELWLLLDNSMSMCEMLGGIYELL